MLVELKYVEVEIEPEEILSKADAYPSYPNDLKHSFISLVIFLVIGSLK